MYELAVDEARIGRHADAIRWLEKAVALGYDFEPDKEPAFAPLKKFEPYKELAHSLNLRQPVRTSALAFRVREPQLVPEGIAALPDGSAFFVGSLAQKKIIRVAPDGSARDFVPSGRDGLWTVLGLKVDAKRRLLWAAAAADGREGAAAGSSGLFAFDLETGALRRKLTLDGRARKHLFNDIALTDAGDVFVTDSEAGAVYRLAAGADVLQDFLAAATFIYPNGIALAPGERTLYVADASEGLTAVDVASKRRTPLAHPKDVTLHSVDGLYADGATLVAIQNGQGMERVVRFALDPAGTRVQRLDVLESRNPDFDIPTTGAIVGRDFFYLGNTQLERLGDDGRLAPGPPFTDILVFKSRLP
ncbi:MAG TPA: SMP-30/gluconolactonase/LRE family protein [Thermoanaerobaculia bacterium]|jgi:sugar lactone lactonase YvrE